ncbi:hypothetical protein BOH66_12545 [Microbacterium aurum]|uniref:Uncharacterized protein n=1 Tax=Microbacterium aurum TaxID=36805 RepID=A0A1P8UA34_9MICO|nr:hypothetical protein BOH66_12545 [Microbacterium aurum]
MTPTAEERTDAVAVASAPRADFDVTALSLGACPPVAAHAVMRRAAVRDAAGGGSRRLTVCS